MVWRRFVTLLRDQAGLRGLQLALKAGAQRATAWVVGGMATGASVVYAPEDNTRRKGASVVPSPAAEGFKDPLFEDLLESVEETEEEILAANESVVWLNESIAPMWPFLNEGLREFVYSKLQPAIQEAVPVVGGQLRFKNLTLGEEAPQLGPVTARRTDDGVELHVGVHYTGDLTLDFDAGLANVHLGDLRINGEVMVAFRPLVNGINPIGGLEITCLDQPDIHLSLRARGMLLDMIPNLYKLIKHTVDDVIAGILVMPNNIAVTIPTVTGPKTDKPQLKYPEPVGVLRLKVSRAKDLAGLDWNWKGECTSDPYVRAQVGAAYWFTDTVPASNNPVWSSGNEQDFVVYHPNQNVLLEVLDENVVKADELIGKAALPVKKLMNDGVATVHLRSATGGASTSKLEVEGKWMPLLPTAPATPKLLPAGGPPLPEKRKHAWRNGTAAGSSSEVLVSVRVDEVVGLAGNSESGPYRVKAVVNGKSRVTEEGRGCVPSVRLDPLEIAEMARRMSATGVKLSAIAKVLETDESHCHDFMEREKRRDRTLLPRRLVEKEEAEDKEWGAVITKAWQKRSAAFQPQFGQILHIAAEPTERVTLQLLGSRKGPDGKEMQRNVVLATTEVDVKDLCNDRTRSHGPFELAPVDKEVAKDVTDGTCYLHGHIQLKELATA